MYFVVMKPSRLLTQQHRNIVFPLCSCSVISRWELEIIYQLQYISNKNIQLLQKFYLHYLSQNIPSNQTFFLYVIPISMSSLQHGFSLRLNVSFDSKFLAIKNLQTDFFFTQVRPHFILNSSGHLHSMGLNKLSSPVFILIGVLCFSKQFLSL